MSAETKTLFSGFRAGTVRASSGGDLPNGMTARLLQPFRVRTGAGRIIEVPAGFETDFASVPRLFWRVVPPWGRYSRRPSFTTISTTPVRSRGLLPTASFLN